jgi:hypothetical protein
MMSICDINGGSRALPVRATDDPADATAATDAPGSVEILRSSDLDLLVLAQASSLVMSKTDITWLGEVLRGEKGHHEAGHDPSARNRDITWQARVPVAHVERARRP